MRNIKALGVSAVIALALMVCAGGASASVFESANYPTTLTGSGVWGPEIKTQMGTVKCFAPTLSGALGAQSAAPALGADSSNHGCSSGTLKANNCQITLHGGTKVTEGGSFIGTVDIGGVGCGGLTVTGMVLPGCDINILPQSGLAATFVNEASGKVRVSVTAGGLKYTATSNCPNGGAGTYTNGAYTGSWEVSGNNGAFKVSNAPVGLFLAGKESAEPANQPRFEGTSYPALISGTQTAPKLEFKTKTGTTKCQTAKFNGEISKAASELGLNPIFGECLQGGILNAPISMNSCRYVIHASNAGPPYVGTFDVACTTIGDAITISLQGLKCVVHVPAQTGLTGLSFENVGTGTAQQVKATLNLAGIAYSLTGGECWYVEGAEGSYTDGTLKGAITLSALK